MAQLANNAVYFNSICMSSGQLSIRKLWLDIFVSQQLFIQVKKANRGKVGFVAFGATLEDK